MPIFAYLYIALLLGVSMGSGLIETEFSLEKKKRYIADLVAGIAAVLLVLIFFVPQIRKELWYLPLPLLAYCLYWDFVTLKRELIASRVNDEAMQPLSVGFIILCYALYWPAYIWGIASLTR